MDPTVKRAVAAYRATRQLRMFGGFEPKQENLFEQWRTGERPEAGAPKPAPKAAPPPEAEASPRQPRAKRPKPKTIKAAEDTLRRKLGAVPPNRLRAILRHTAEQMRAKRDEAHLAMREAGWLPKYDMTGRSNDRARARLVEQARRAVRAHGRLERTARAVYGELVYNAPNGARDELELYNACGIGSAPTRELERRLRHSLARLRAEEKDQDEERRETRTWYGGAR